MGEPRWLFGDEGLASVAVDAPSVWLVDLNDPAVRRRAEAIGLRPEDHRRVAARMDAGERLIRWRLARLLLARATTQSPDTVMIDHDEAGAPVVLSPAGWHLSLAARWPRCLIGIAPTPLGVDLETGTEPLPSDLLTVHERQVAGRDPHRWAAKEAHAKWTRRPLDLEPADIDAATPPFVTSRFGTTRCWLYDGGDYAAAMCTA